MPLHDSSRNPFISSFISPSLPPVLPLCLKRNDRRPLIRQDAVLLECQIITATRKEMQNQNFKNSLLTLRLLCYFQQAGSVLKRRNL